MYKHHYVYRITNTKEQKHYYGVRSSKVEPKLDLGIKYFSSSRDKDFIKEQKVNKDIFKYKIVKIFKSRKEAIEHEIILHKKFDVKSHKHFYNESNQTSTGFDTSGKIPWNKGLESKYKGVPRSEETKQRISNAVKGVKQTDEHRVKNSESKKGMIYIHKNGIAKKVYPDKLEDFLTDGWIKGKLPMREETKQKIRESNRCNTVINNKVEQKVIKLIHLDKYILDGWTHGQLPRSKEHCEKLSKSIKGFKHSEETKHKMGLAHKNKEISEDHKMKISKANKGKPKSEETKRKISESKKRRN
jgi:hypothetical protein